MKSQTNMTYIPRKSNGLCTFQLTDGRKGKRNDVQIYTEALEVYERDEADEWMWKNLKKWIRLSVEHISKRNKLQTPTKKTHISVDRSQPTEQV
jgi:hypothetical protein